MDPLSVTSAIIGLLAATAKLQGLLEYISSASNSPATILEAQTEVRHVELALRSLRRYLWRLDLVSPDRKALISVDELIVSLTDAMVAMAEFEGFLQPLAKWKPVQLPLWFRYSKQLERHTKRAQHHKHTLTLMVNIMQCESDLEAAQSQARLQLLVEETLAENRELKARVSQLKDYFEARSTLSPPVEDSITTIFSHDDLPESTSSRRERSFDDPFTNAINPHRSTFEADLEQSRVYRRQEGNECDGSFVGSYQRLNRWSVFSGYSLADISIVSVIAMPLTALEVAQGPNHHHYHHRDATDSLQAPPRSNKYDLNSTESPGFPQLNIQPEAALRRFASTDSDRAAFLPRSLIPRIDSICNEHRRLLADDNTITSDVPRLSNPRAEIERGKISRKRSLNSPDGEGKEHALAPCKGDTEQIPLDIG